MQENLTALQRSVDSMEDKGMSEDPRFSQMMMRGRPPLQVRISNRNLVVVTFVSTKVVCGVTDYHP